MAWVEVTTVGKLGAYCKMPKGYVSGHREVPTAPSLQPGVPDRTFLQPSYNIPESRGLPRGELHPRLMSLVDMANKVVASPGAIPHCGYRPRRFNKRLGQSRHATWRTVVGQLFLTGVRRDVACCRACALVY